MRTATRSWTACVGNALAVACIYLVIAYAAHAEVKATIAVGATVLPVATMTLHGPDVIEISAADVQKGFVEMRTATLLEVHSNSRSGFALNVLPATSVFSSIELRAANSVVVLGPDGGTIVNRWHSNERQCSLALTHRFKLVPGLAPGLYPWPLRYEVVPL